MTDAKPLTDDALKTVRDGLGNVPFSLTNDFALRMLATIDALRDRVRDAVGDTAHAVHQLEQMKEALETVTEERDRLKKAGDDNGKK